MLKHTEICLESKLDCTQQENIIFSNCEKSFIDDLCISLLEKNERHNFQLKNSNTTGKWSKTLQKKFSLQDKLDEKIHNTVNYTHTLVCSDECSVVNNKQQMPKNAKYYSLYYPYHKTQLEMINDPKSELKSLLSKVCRDSQQLETALRIIGSPLHGAQDFRQSLGDWWKAVIESSKPNIFIPLQTQVFPQEIINHLESHGFLLSDTNIIYKGFSVKITVELLNKLQEESVIEKLISYTSAKELVTFLNQLSCPVMNHIGT